MIQKKPLLGGVWRKHHNMETASRDITEIIALRDIADKYREPFIKEVEKDENVLIKEIKNGYKHPLFVTKIIQARLQILNDQLKDN